MTFFTAVATPPTLGWVDVLLRLCCALVVGAVIGLEREYTHRPAGLRTHMLVTLGACVVMITGQFIYTEYSKYGSNADPARLAAQVVSGVGFLGAGTIMREGVNVKGLTTAASLWAVACLGIAAGAGYYAIAIPGAVFVLASLTIFEYLQKALVRNPGNRREYELETNDVPAALSLITDLSHETFCQISNLQATNLGDNNYRLRFQADFERGKTKQRRKKFFEALAASSACTSVRILEDTVHAK